MEGQTWADAVGKGPSYRQDLKNWLIKSTYSALRVRSYLTKLPRDEAYYFREEAGGRSRFRTCIAGVITWSFDVDGAITGCTVSE